MAGTRVGPLGRALGASDVLRILYASLLFVPVVISALLFSFLGRWRLMVLSWRAFAAGLGLTHRVHGAAPPADAPALWVSNHFNWFDWPVLQAAAPYQLCAVVKADLALDTFVGRILATWARNLGALFYTRGDRKSGATVRSKIAGHAGAVLVFAEGTTQAYGPPMVDKMRPGAIEAAFESGKLVQPAAIYYSARIGWGFGPESNGLRQTALICARPTVAALQLCPALRPADFATAEALFAAVQQSMVDAYTQLEQRYKDWPTERISAPPA